MIPVVTDHLALRCAEREIPPEAAVKAMTEPEFVAWAKPDPLGNKCFCAIAPAQRNSHREWLTVVFRDEGEKRIGFTAFWGRPGGRGSRQGEPGPNS